MKRTLVGTVVSTSGDKTAVINVARHAQHPLYLKRYTISKKYQVHDPKNEATVGDMIQVSEIRPVSKHKQWQLDKILRTEDGKK